MGRGIIIGNDAYKIKRLEERISELETKVSKIPYNISYDEANENLVFKSDSTLNKE